MDLHVYSLVRVFARAHIGPPFCPTTCLAAAFVAPTDVVAAAKFDFILQDGGERVPGVAAVSRFITTAYTVPSIRGTIYEVTVPTSTVDTAATNLDSSDAL